jgi:hypothetical protein
MTDNQNTTDNAENTAPKDKFSQFVDHESKAFEESLKAFEALLPEGFKQHGREAGKEFAAGFRVLLDAAAEAIEKASKEMDERMKAHRSAEADDAARPSTTGANKVKVQVE